MAGFKDFVLRGNVVDLAVGVIIGAAFTGIVDSMTTSSTALIKLLLPAPAVSRTVSKAIPADSGVPLSGSIRAAKMLQRNPEDFLPAAR